MRALVTGGCGFIGANLARALAHRGDDVTVLDRRPSHPLLPETAVHIVTGYVMDITRSFLAGFDVVFHQAAYTDTTIDDADVRPLRVMMNGMRVDLPYAARSGKIEVRTTTLWPDAIASEDDRGAIEITGLDGPTMIARARSTAWRTSGVGMAAAAPR